MQDQDRESELGKYATVARETFEYNIIPWADRKYARWVRAWSRAHPSDPSGLVQVPEVIYRAFQSRPPGQRMSKQVAQSLGYPRVPGERELDRVRQELHDALGRCDWGHAHDLDSQLRDLQERVAEMRLVALPAR